MIGAAGNPQSQINPGVDGCDIFIGMVHRRWGTATGNGFDSGFGEEFTRALDRWEREGEPRIALFFKQVDGESLRDPGDQLKKVLEFRNSIEKRHSAFYNLFESTDQLKMQVFQLLVEAIVRLPAEPQTEVAGTSTGDPAETAASDRDRGPSELSTVLAAFADVTAGREPTTKLDVDRLELFGLSASRDDDPIPTHLANRIFTRREEVSLHRVEAVAWFRTYLMDLGRASKAWDRVIPFASVAGGTEQLGELLDDSAVKVLTSKDAHLVAGWLRLAAALKVRPKSIWLAPPLDEAQQSTLRDLWANATTSTPLAIAYWLSVRRRQYLQLAKILAEGNSDSLRSLGELLVGLLRRTPDATPLARSMPDLLINPSVSEVFRDGNPLASLSAADLENLVLRGYLDKAVRLQALDELIGRDAVPSTVIKAVLKDEGSTSFIGRSWSADALERLFDRAVSTSFMNRFMEIIGGPNDKLDDSARAAIARMARHSAPIDEIVASLLQDKVYLDADDASMLLSRHEGTRTEALDVAECCCEARTLSPDPPKRGGELGVEPRAWRMPSTTSRSGYSEAVTRKGKPLATIRPVFDDLNLVSDAGLVPAMLLAESAGLHDLLAGQVSATAERCGEGGRCGGWGWPARTASAIWTCCVMAAWHRLFAGVRAPSTLGTFLRSFTSPATCSNSTLSGQAGWAVIAGAGPDQGLAFLDVDDTIREVSPATASRAPATAAPGPGRTSQPRPRPRVAPNIRGAAGRQAQHPPAQGAGRTPAKRSPTARAGMKGHLLCRADSTYYGVGARRWAHGRHRRGSRLPPG